MLFRSGELESRIQGTDRLQVDLESFSSFCKQVSSRLRDFGFEDKTLALRALSAKVTANGRKYLLDIDLPAAGLGTGDGEMATTY